ncbi:PKD domain-containing protein [Bacteroidota bacterium]
MGNPITDYPVTPGVGITNYDLVVVDGDGCTTTETVSITVNSVPTANAGLDQDMCLGIGATLTGSATGGTGAGTYAYSWSNGAGTALTTVNPAILGPNTYTLTVTDGNLCTDTEVVDIDVKDNPTVTASADITSSCNGEDVTLTGVGAGGLGPYSYDWGAAGVGTPLVVNPTNPVAGDPPLLYTYTVTTTDANSCIGTDNVDVTVNSPANIIIANDGSKYCQDPGDITLSATPAGGGWANIAGGLAYVTPNTFDPTANGSGFFTLEYTYTDPAPGGCITTKQATFEILPYSTPNALTISDPNSGLYCATDAGPYTITGSEDQGLTGQAGVVETLTSTGAGLTDNGDGTASFDPSVATAGVYTITYDVTTPGCSNSTTTNITVGTAVTYNNPVSMCVNDADIALVASNVVGEWTITFVDDATSTTNIYGPYTHGDPNALLQTTEAGTYTIDYVLTTPGEYNCSASATTIVYDLPAVNFTIDGNPHTDLDINFCDNGSVVTLVGNNATNNVFSGAGVAANKFDPTTGAGGYIITYTHTDINGCVNSVNSETVTVNGAPVVTIDGLDADYCNSATPVTITGNPTTGAAPGVFSFPGSWTNTQEYTFPLAADGTATLDPTAVDPTGSFNINYQVTDLNGCTGTVTDIVDINPLPTVDFAGLPATICNNGTAVTLTGSPTNANGTFSGDGITPLGPGTATFDPSGIATGNHTITYTYTDPVTLCQNSQPYTVNVLTLPNKYTVTAPTGLEYCETDAGITIGVSNSQDATHTYYLMRNGITQVASQAGASGAFNFGVASFTDGNYTVIAENLAGCQLTFDNTVTSVEVAAIAGAGAISGSTSICADGVTTYTYSVPLITNATDHVWILPAGVSLDFDGDNTIDVIFDPSYVSGSQIEVYGNDVTSVCPAGNSSFLTITSNPIPTDDVGPAPVTSSTGVYVVCEGQTGIVFSVDPDDFSDETEFEWQVSAGTATIVSAITASSVTVDFGAGSVTGTIQVRAVNACGNTAWISQAITVNPIPNVSINALGPGDAITCDAASQVQLNAASTEPGGTITGWLWSSSNGGIIVPGDETVIDPFVTKEGDFDVQIEVTNNLLACYNTATITVGADKVAPAVTIDPAEDLTCTNLSIVTLQANAVNVSYDWTFTPPANITTATNISNPSVDQPGTYTITVTDLTNSCTASASVTIADDTALPDVSVVTPSVDVLTCTDLTAVLDGASSTLNKTFLWTGPDPTIINETLEDATVDVAGVYQLEVTDTDNGCISTANVTVTEDVAIPVAVITNIDAIHTDLTCTNTEIDIEASVAAVPTATFVWSTAGGNFVSQTGANNQFAEVDIAATYTVVATNPTNGCVSIATNEIIAEDLSTATTTNITSAGTELTCINSGTLNLVADITGDAAGTYTWSGTGVLVPPLNANNVDVTSSGTYTLTYAHSVTGCETTANIVVTDETASPTVSINAGPYIITCADLSATEAITPTLTATGDADPLTTYLWTGPVGATYSDNTALSTTVDISGTYTITATNQYGCTVTDNIAVTSNTTAPTITVVDPATNDITCASPTVTLSGGTSTGTATLLWTGPVGSTITNPTTINPTVDLAGVYTLTVTDAANGCTATDNVTVSDNFDSPNISVTDPAADELTCDDTQVQLSTSTPVAGVTYAWTGPVGATITNVNSSDPWVDMVGTYTVIATHPTSGCTQTETIDVNSDYQQPVVNIIPEALIITCTQSTINLDASSSTNATSFAWSTVDGNIVSGGTTNTAVISQAGTYDLIVTNGATGCTETGQVIVTDDLTAPNVNITGGPYTITCTDPTPELTATVDVGSSVVWTGPGTILNSTTTNPTVDAAGTYVITATAANGCTATDNILVTLDNANPDITVDTNTDDITCTNTLVTVSGSSITLGVTYLWEVLSGGGNITNATSATTTVDADGDYRLTVTAPNGCTNTDVVTVGENVTPPNVNLPATDDEEITCNQTTVTLNGSSSTGGAQFSWSTLIAGATITNGNSPTPIVDKTGDYYIVVTDPVNGCTSNDTTTVNGTFTIPTINIAAVGSQITCTNTTIILDASGSTNATNYSWTASLGGHILSNGNTSQPTVDAAGRYTVTAEHTTTGCTASDFVDVTEDNSVPVIDVFDPFPGEITCTNTTVTLSADATGLGVNKDISWATSDGNFTTATNISNPTVDQGGTYVVTITNTDNNCSTVRSVTIDENTTAPSITIVTPLDFTCSVTQVNLNATGTSVDASPVTYAWAAGAGGNIVSGAATATAVVDAVADYTVTVTDLGNGCTNNSTVSTTEDITPPDVSVDTNPDQITCDNATVILNGSSTYPNVSYQWTTSGSGTIQNATTSTPIVNAAGTYNLTVTNTDNNCTATSADVIVTEDKVDPTVTVNAPSGDLTCNVTAVTISVSENVDYSYSWSGPGSITTPNSHSTNVDDIGTYTVIVEDISNGCTNSYTVDVTDDKTPSASPVINDIETCYGSANPSFNVISGTNVQWYNDAALTTFLASGNSYTPAATTAGTHTFYATSTGANGCESLPTEVVFTIHALPIAPTTMGNAICEGNAAEELTAIGSNVNWYNNTSTFLASGSTYIPADVIVGTYTYYATQTDAEGCGSAQTAATYTINSIPAQPVFTNPNMEICETETNPIFTVVGDNVQWYKTIGGAAISTGNTYQPIDLLPAVYTYYATQTVSGCKSPESTGTFTINEIPEVYSIENGGSYCEGTAGVDISLSNSEIDVNYELWLDAASMIIDVAGTGAAISFGNQSLEGNYTVYAYNDTTACRDTMNGSVNVSIDPLPDDAPTITGSSEVCQNETGVSFGVTAIANATNYIWTVPAGFTIVSGSNSNSITVDIDDTAVSGNITVYATNACGVGTTSPILFITVNPIPGNALNLTGPAVICNDEDGVTYSIDADPDATFYNWTLPQGASIIAGANSRQITLDFDQTAVNDVIIVTAANACGEGNSASQLITVNDLPYVSAGDQQDLCVDNTIMDANTPASGTGTWSIYSGAVTLSNINNPFATATNIGEGNNRLVWTIVDGNGCNLSDTVLITNNTVIVEAGNNQVVCEESITLDGSVVPVGAIGSWSATTGSANFSDGNSPTAVASGFTTGINILNWTVTKGGCTNYDTLIIDNQRPTQAYAGIDLSICGDSTVLGANNPATGTGLWTVVVGAATFENNTIFNTKVSGLSKGENILRWTISNGICSTSDEVTVYNNSIDVNAGVDQIICDNIATLSATALASGTGYWSIRSGSGVFVDFEDPTTIVTAISQGPNVYTWNINNNSCISSDSVIITNDSPTDAYAGKDTTVTTNLTTLQGNIPLIGNGSWSIISGSGNIEDLQLNNTVVSSLGLGENIFRWTVTHNSCISIDDVTVTNANASPPNAGSDQTLCTDYTTLEGNDPLFGYGEWSVVNGSATFADNSSPAVEVTGLAKGNNVLKWSIWENGWSSDTVIITNDSPTDANAGLDKVLCADSVILAGNDPIIGTGMWTIISGAASFENDTVYNTKVTNLAKGENTFKWTISNRACSDEDVVVIRNDLPTVAEAGDDALICESTITLSPNTPSVGTGIWSVASGSGYFEGNTAKNIARGDNIFVWTIEKNACSYSDSIRITNYEPSDANAGADKIICVDTITIKANPAVYGTGIWNQESGSATFDVNNPNASVTNLSQGLNVFKWTITYNSCVKSDRVTINNASVTATTGPDQEICSESTYLEANNPSIGTGMWSILGGSGSATFTNINASDTWVTDLDKGDNILRWTITNEICSDFAEVTITNNLPTEAFAGPDQALCADNSILQGNTPIHGTGVWSILSGSADITTINDPSSTVSNLDYGVNTLRWTITNGTCVSTDEVVIANNSTIQSNAGLDQTLCADSTLLFANIPAYGMGTWSVVTGSATFENNNDYNTKVTNIGRGDNILRWVITNGGCSSNDEVTITNNYPIKAIAGGDQTICGNTTYLQANSPQSYNGTWTLVSGAAVFENSTLNNTQVTGLNPGSNTLRWTINNSGCTSSDDVVVYNDLPYEAEAGEDFNVCGPTTSMYANDPITGVGQWSVISGSATFDDASQFDANVSGLGFGANTLRWTITYDQCTTIDEIIVTNNKIQVNAGPDQTVAESTTMLTASNPSSGTGQWSTIGGSGTFDDEYNAITFVTGLGSGLNTFRWSVDNNGCISYDDVSVTYNVAPVASFVITNSEGCPPLEVYFVNNSLDNLSFIWTFDNGDTSSLVSFKRIYNESGTYTPSLTVYGLNGEVVTKDTTITVYPQPKASFLIVNTEIYIPEEEAIFINESVDAITYQWEFGDGSTSTETDPKHIYENEGIYDIVLHAWSENDCYDVLKVIGGVEVYESGTIIFPNAFTPNLEGSSSGYYNANDFSNDVFFPIGEGLENYHLEIFNKWGILVFESNDITIGWDGYFNGELLGEGVYVWKVTGKLNNGKDFNKVGTVLLIQ